MGTYESGSSGYDDVFHDTSVLVSPNVGIKTRMEGMFRKK